MFGYFLLVVAIPMCLTFSNCTDDAVNNLSLTEHVKQIDEILATYQAQYQAQERKDATILANILSELSQTKQDMAKLQTNHNITLSLYQQTVSELVDLKTSHNKTVSELWDLKTSHNKTVSELWDLKTSHNKTVSELSDLRSSHNKAVSELSILQKKLNETVSETSALQTSHNKTVFEVSALQKSCNDTTLELSALQKRTNDTTFQLSAALDKSHNEAVLELSTLTNNQNQTNLDLIETRSQLEEMKTQLNASITTGIGFEANLMKAKTIPASAIIIFDNVQHNHGEGYDRTTGYFTAPVSGTYLFWTNIVYRSHKSIEFYIQTRLKVYGRAYGRANEVFGTASVTTLVHLKQGERAWVRSAKETELMSLYPSAGAVLIKQY